MLKLLHRVMRSRFVRNQAGGVAVYIAFATPMFILAGAIVIDLSRLYSLDTELQNAADAMSLAGVVELNRETGARDRARAAALDAVNNVQYFAADDTVVQTSVLDCDTPNADLSGGCMRFLRSLPDNDADPITSDNIALDEALDRLASA